MTIAGSRLVNEGLFFLIIFLSGLWMSRTGKPYSTLILTLHKLIGLTALGFLVVAAYRLQQSAMLSPIGMTAVLVTVFLFVGLIASGGLLSAVAEAPAAVSMMHKLLPYLALVSTATTVYLIS